MDREWYAHWINDLISQETIDKLSFSEWMWCPERVTDEKYQFMGELWDKRKYGDK